MSTEPEPTAEGPLPPRGSPRWQWLGICLVATLVAVPLFHSLPSGMKRLGLHSAALAAVLGLFTAAQARSMHVAPWKWVRGLAVVLALASFAGLLGLGYRDQWQRPSQGFPMPALTQTDDPESVARALQMRELLQEAARPRLVDYLAWRYQALRLPTGWVIPVTLAEALGCIAVALLVTRPSAWWVKS